METMNGLMEFLYVAENASFSEAARKLKVSKSHISKQVTRLEEGLNVRLFNRTTRKVSLTEVGQQLYLRSRNLFNEYEEIKSEISKSQEAPTGTVRLSVAGAFAENYLTEAIVSFSKEFPKIKIEVVFSGDIVDLIEQNFDLAIRHGKLNSSSLVAKKLVNRKEVVCATPEYLKKFGVPKTPSDLKKHNCLLGTAVKWNFLENKKKKSLHVTGSLSFNNGHALTKAVLASAGIARLPGTYINEYLQEGELKSLLEKYIPDDQGIWLVFQNKQFMPQRLRVLIDFLTEYFQKNYRGIDF